jgi:predicted site-specific integrase-resolvase
MEQVQEALTRREIAKRLGVTVRTLDRYRKKGRVSLTLISEGHYLYTMSDDKAEVALSALKRLNAMVRRLEKLERSMKELEYRSIADMLEVKKVLTEQKDSEVPIDIVMSLLKPDELEKLQKYVVAYLAKHEQP